MGDVIHQPRRRTRVRGSRAALVLTSGVGLLLLLPQTVAAAGTVTHITIPSAADPNLFASCAVGGPGRNYTNSEVEPLVAVDRHTAGHLVAAWQQDRWSNGGAHGLVAGNSTDGGATWTEAKLPFGQCGTGAANQAPYDRASDPWVTLDHAGKAYANDISFNNATGDNGVFASVSSNGTSWSSPVTLKADTGFQFFNDKNSITADPRASHAGTAYAVWDRLEAPNGNPDADLHTHAFQGPTWFSKTTDGGVTWTDGISSGAVSRSIFNPGQQNQTIGNVIVVSPTGALYDFFDLILHNGHSFNVAFIRSTDGGATWSEATIISTLGSIGVSDPNNLNPVTGTPPAPIRTGDIIPEPAIDAGTGQLYVVWQDARFSGHDEIAIATSLDGGATWTAPKRVDTPNGNPAFTAAPAVASDSTVGVTYYQWGATASGSEPTTYLIKKFAPSDITAAGSDSLSSISATTVKAPFNMLDAPFARGYFTGDYEGLDTVGTTFEAFFVATNCADLSCSALTSVVAPTNRTPTNNNSTDPYAGSGF
jgi:hypothetical protein